MASPGRTTARTPLPIDAVLPALLAAVRSRGVAVLHATPGAGKTTRVPPALADALAGAGQVVVVEPRRVAARAAARRIADERGWTLGGEIGWWIRFERRFRPDSRVVFATEGVLLRWLQRDPFLDGVAALIFDEFHERALPADLALALARRVRREARPDLHLLVMSATLDVEPLATWLDDAPVIRCAGRIHPVEIRLLERPDDRPLEQQVADAVRRAARQTDGDLLAFLPGRAEITRTEALLVEAGARSDFDLYPLHGDLPGAQQDAALRRGPRRRIVLATNLAETSVTVEGVRAVIDSGLARQQRFDPASGLDRLTTIQISRAAADQRAGRAGREAPGLCLRLWHAGDDLARRPFEPPEVQRVDLAGAVLELAVWGEADPDTFDWYEAPDPARLARARRTLRDLGALDDYGVTPLGRRMAALPLTPRLARLVLEGERLGVEEGAAQLAALLAERDPFGAEWRGDARAGSRSDLLDRLDALDRRRHRRIFDAAAQILTRLAASDDRNEKTKLSVQDKNRDKDKSLIEEKNRDEGTDGGGVGRGGSGDVRDRRDDGHAGSVGAVGDAGRGASDPARRPEYHPLAGTDNRPDLATDAPPPSHPPSMPSLPLPLPLNRKPSSLSLSSPSSSTPTQDGDEPLLRAIAAAYLDRLCRRRAAGADRAVMVGGAGVRLARSSAVRGNELFVAVELAAGRGGERSEALVRLASGVERDWLPPELVRSADELAWDSARERVVARRVVRFDDLELDAREIPLPRVDDEAVTGLLVEQAAAALDRALPLDAPEVAALCARVAFLRAALPQLELPVFDTDFLRALLPRLAAGRRSFEELRRAPLAAALLGELTWPQRQALDREAPERLAVPSGSQIRLDYSDPARPVLAARIQELFGLLDTPRLAGGRVAVLLHLLAPNGRPQQVTDDLASFWRSTYPIVRRELAGRYPKHAWPDDPTTARPQRRPGRR